MAIPKLEGMSIGTRERVCALALIPIGILSGVFFQACHKGCGCAFGFLRSKGGVVCCAVLGGVALGLMGMAVPFCMFSGEEQMEELSQVYVAYAPLALVGIGAAKLLLTNVCIQSGWKGGHFFPVIFSGASIGFGAGVLLQVNPVFAAAVVTASLLGYMMRKPVAVSVLLLLCFPAEGIVWMLCAAAAGALPHSLLGRDAQKG